jgi:prepilin-type N-terminal cleavage/methylation domain-containing protein
MNRNNKKKAGFTLVELMVVAIIVAILAAVAIPLMLGNKRRALATEADAGVGAVQTAMRVYLATTGTYPTNGIYSSIPGAGAHDLDGVYFWTSDYAFTQTGSNYIITATGNSAGSLAPQKTQASGITVVLDSTTGQIAHNGL